jgi:hypothetical protein
MKIAYIVSLYFGTRRVQASGYRQDKLFYLRKHIEHLTRLKHSCSKIIFVINHSLDHQEITETKRAIKLILDFKVEHSDKKVEILRRENSGMSYAAWDEALKRSCKDVDYTFLIEDDYCPVSNNFDEKFLHYFAENQKLAYVCQLWWTHNAASPFHAGISNGLLSMTAYFSSGGFKINCKSGYDTGIENQKCFLNLLTDHGYEVRDTGDVYRNYFLNHLSELKIYGNKDGEDLILPIHENAKWV